MNNESLLMTTGELGEGLSYFQQINLINAQILMELSGKRKPEYSRQPQQRYGVDPNSARLSEKLAEKDWVYVTSIAKRHGNSSIMLKKFTYEANRWIAATHVLNQSCVLATDQDILERDQVNETNFKAIEVREASYGRDTDGNQIPKPSRDRTVKI